MRYAVLSGPLLPRGVLLAALVLLVAAPAAQVTFDATVNVSNTGGDSRQPHIAVDAAGVLHVAWADDTGSPGDYRILYARSFNRGQTFTSALTLSMGSGAALRPRLATVGTAVYVVWHEDVSDTKEIMFARSTDGGASWSARLNVSNTVGMSQEGRIAVDGAGTIYVVWDEATPTRHIALARSFNGGGSFEAPRVLFGVVMGSPSCTTGITGSCTPYPGIAVDRASGRVYVVWHDRPTGDFQVYVSRSADGGTSFSAPLNISHGAVHSHCAALTVGPTGKVHVTYENRKDLVDHKHDALYVQSTNGGASFSAPRNLSSGPAWAFSDYPWPAEAPNGLIAVGWEDNTQGGELDAVVATSSDGGQTFTASQNLSNNATSTSTEVVTLFGPDGTLYVVWEDYQNGQAEVFLRRAVGIGAAAGGGGGDDGGPTGSGAFTGGVYVAAANLSGPGAPDIITGAGPGGGPHVRAFKPTNKSLAPSFFAYAAGFTGGVRVAACDLDGDGRPEIVTAAGPGGGPEVRVFRVSASEAAPLAQLAGVFPYPAGYTGGVYVACGDIDGDGRAEVITGAGEGGGAHIRAFRYEGGALVPTEVSFLAYDPGFTGGVRVAVGKLKGVGPVIITAAGPGGGPHIQAFRVSPGAPGGVVPTGLSFFAYDPGFRAGIYVAAGDLDGDGFDEIVTGAGAGGGPHVIAWTINGTQATPGVSFFAYDAQFTGGVRVAAAAGTIVTGTGPGSGTLIRSFTGAGVATGTSFFAY